MSRRVSGTAIEVEQKPDINYRRVSAGLIVVEQKPTPNYRRISSAAIQVEYIRKGVDKKPAYLEGVPIGTSTLDSTQVYLSGDALEDLLPSGDTYTGEWINEDTGSELYTHLDSVDDSEYVYRTTAQNGDYFRVSLAAPDGTPDKNYFHVMEWRAKNISGDPITMKAELYQGAVLIASDTQVVSADFQTFEYYLTQSEIDNITDYSDLSIKIIVEDIT